MDEILPKDLLNILVCPACKKALDLIPIQVEQWGLKCQQCCLTYPIREGIPIMLIEEAIKSGN